MTNVYRTALLLSLPVIVGVMIAGCEPGTETMPKPREVCTVITGQYACGRGGTCQQCGKWQIGCHDPLQLRQEPTGSYDKGEPRLVCRMKETSDVSVVPMEAAPLR